MTKGELAEANFKEGRTCCQAVLLAFERESGLDRETLLKLGAPFGGGMGRLRQTCGAFTAAVMLGGLIKSGGGRAADYKLVQDMAADFTERNGSIVCSALLSKAGAAADTAFAPSPRTESYYKKRPCALLCKSAAEIAEKWILGAKEGE